MSIVKTHPPPAEISDLATTRHRRAKGLRKNIRDKDIRDKDTRDKTRPQRDETALSADELQRQRSLAIQSEAVALLRNSSYYPLRCVSCEVSRNALTLSGQVPSYYMKQMAQTIVRHLLDGRLVIDNQLEVDRK